MTLIRVDWVYAGSAAGGLGAGGLGIWLWVRRRRDPEEAERRRREQVNRVGRITQAEILEVAEYEAEPARRRRWRFWHSSIAGRPARRLILYRYTISGVRYETAQELTGIFFDIPLPQQGHVVTVKYDPARPGNSILVAEKWSGLGDRRPSAAGPGKGR